MARRKKEGIISELNVVPYIDVMLVLLIIFMTTAPMLTHGIKVDLPKTSKSTPVNPSEEITYLVVTVDERGQYFLSANQVSEETPLTLNKLLVLVKAYKVKKDKIKVYIRADKQARYDYVATLINLLKDHLEIDNVGLMTEPKG